MILNLVRLSCFAVWLVAFTIVILIGLWVYAQLSMGYCKSKRKLVGKTVVITGGTSGIGKESVRDFYKRGARIVVGCLIMDEGKEAKRDILKEKTDTPGTIVLHHLDLSSFDSIRKFASNILREEQRLDILVHNAGTAQFCRKRVSEDGLEMTMAVNYYGAFLLTHLLIDLMKKSAPARIVVTSSVMHLFAHLQLDNLNPKNYFPGYLYCLSKRASVFFTLELARRLKKYGITANCLHPGIVNTAIWSNIPTTNTSLVKLFFETYAKSSKQGAQTIIYLAVSEEVEEVTGKYFSDCKESKLYFDTKNPIKGKKFWEACESIVKLRPSDPRI